MYWEAKNSCDSLYCNIYSLVVVWTETHSLSKAVSLYTVYVCLLNTFGYPPNLKEHHHNHWHLCSPLNHTHLQRQPGDHQSELPCSSLAFFEKAEKPEITVPQHPLDRGKSKRIPEKYHFCFTDHTNALTGWITTNCGKLLKRCEYQTTVAASCATCRSRSNR